jgi:hypothetical protein|tara:strand:+ start:1143 stop:1403 length:261 start_codon:yes stop_codon:yes gene_type:complete
MNDRIKVLPTIKSSQENARDGLNNLSAEMKQVIDDGSFTKGFTLIFGEEGKELDEGSMEIGITSNVSRTELLGLLDVVKHYLLNGN